MVQPPQHRFFLSHPRVIPSCWAPSLPSHPITSKCSNQLLSACANGWCWSAYFPLNLWKAWRKKPSKVMEKLQSQRERRKKRERTKPIFIFLRVAFLHSHFQHLHYSSCYVSAVPIRLPPCRGKGISPISQSKQSPGHVPQGHEWFRK